jgi:hypothetical protein
MEKIVQLSTTRGLDFGNVVPRARLDIKSSQNQALSNPVLARSQSLPNTVSPTFKPLNAATPSVPTFASEAVLDNRIAQTQQPTSSKVLRDQFQGQASDLSPASSPLFRSDSQVQRQFRLTPINRDSLKLDETGKSLPRLQGGRVTDSFTDNKRPLQNLREVRQGIVDGLSALQKGGKINLNDVSVKFTSADRSSLSVPNPLRPGDKVSGQIELSIGSPIDKRNPDPFGNNPFDQRADVKIPLTIEGTVSVGVQGVLGRSQPLPFIQVDSANLFGTPLPLGKPDAKATSGNLRILLPQTPASRRAPEPLPIFVGNVTIPTGPNSSLLLNGSFNSLNNTAPSVEFQFSSKF